MTTPTITFRATNTIAITTDEATYLFSYDSPILKIVDDEKIVKIYDKYDYSQTTTKHINQFIDKYGYLKLGDVNIFAEDNKTRKKLLDEFYHNQGE